MRVRSAAQLISDVRLRSDQVVTAGSVPFIDDSTILEWVNQGYARLYDKLAKTGEQYNLTQTTITTSNGVFDYQLPPDFFRGVGVDIMIGGYWSPAHRFHFEQRNDYQNVTGDWTWPVFIYYDFWQNSLHFIPTPNGQYPVRLWYVPTAQRMTLNDGGNPAGSLSVMDGINGWEEYVIDWAAKKCAQRDENFDLANSLLADLKETEAHILSMASSRNPTEAPRTRVIRGRLWSPGVPRRWWGW